MGEELQSLVAAACGQWRVSRDDTADAEAMQRRANAAIQDLTSRLSAVEAKLAEAQKDARRFAWLEKQARQKTAYDLFGNGGYWSLGLHSADNRLSFATAIDAAMQQGADN